MVIVNFDTIDQLPLQYAECPDFAAPHANITICYCLEEGRLFKGQIICIPWSPLGETILHVSRVPCPVIVDSPRRSHLFHVRTFGQNLEKMQRVV
jgi:hypothetical protein